MFRVCMMFVLLRARCYCCSLTNRRKNGGQAELFFEKMKNIWGEVIALGRTVCQGTGFASPAAALTSSAPQRFVAVKRGKAPLS